MPEFDPDRAWSVGASVALRPERFGALAYSFETRRLSFLKSQKLFAVVKSLGDHESGRSACAAAGLAEPELGQVLAALGTLASTGMIVARSEA